MTMTSPADAAISGAPPAPGRRVFGCVVVADDRGVDVAEAVELRRAEEADVDAPGLQPVGEDLGHRHDGVGRVGEVAVADREGQPRRLRADAARLVDQRALGRVRAPGEVRGRRRQPDADEAHRVVAQLAGRVDDHEIVGAAALRHRLAPWVMPALRQYSSKSAVPFTCLSIHAVNASRSRETSSHDR